MKVKVIPYNPEWPQHFSRIKSELEAILAETEYVSIEHVGSTSVPGLAAKPIIDISIVSEREDIPAIINALTQSGQYTHLGEMGIPDRHAFKHLPPHSDKEPARNLYASVKDCQSMRNHLVVRDVCRRDPETRDAYGRKKLDLSEMEWKNVDEYCEAKNEILGWVLARAGMSAAEREDIRKVNLAS
jgi:GrpB-like predicted nucleotidyltransferase (UPF0157 family)